MNTDERAKMGAVESGAIWAQWRLYGVALAVYLLGVVGMSAGAGYWNSDHHLSKERGVLFVVFLIHRTIGARCVLGGERVWLRMALYFVSEGVLRVCVNMALRQWTFEIDNTMWCNLVALLAFLICRQQLRRGMDGYQPRSRALAVVAMGIWLTWAGVTGFGTVLMSSEQETSTLFLAAAGPLAAMVAGLVFWARRVLRQGETKVQSPAIAAPSVYRTTLVLDMRGNATVVGPSLREFGWEFFGLIVCSAGWWAYVYVRPHW
jgi:hypothetical protein